MIVGPSYTLNARKADVQRCVNLMPTPLEAPGGKSQMYLAPVPGLRQFGTDEAPLLTTRFFAYDPVVSASPPDAVPTADVIVGRTAFLAALTGYEEEDCETLSPVYANLETSVIDTLGRDPTLTFGAITCTTSGTQTIKDPLDTRDYGRANTTSGGDQYIESRYDDESTGVMPLMTFNFSAPIAAFGAYVTDIDDFGSSVRVWVTDTTGKRYQMSFPLIGGGDTGETSIAFFGFVARGVTFTKIEIARDDNFAYWWEEFGWQGATTDQIGLDDIMVATAAQVIAEPLGYPLPWTTSYGLETWCGLHFNALVTGEVNEFYDSGEFGLVADIRAIDSAADSSAAGTWVTDADFHGKCYACIGERVTLTLPNLTSRGGNAFLSLFGLCVEFEFKRTNMRVGTGEIIHIPGLVSIRCTSGNAIEATLTLAGGSTLTCTGVAALTLNDKVHVRFMAHNQPGENFIRLAIFIDGALDKDSEIDHVGVDGTFGNGTISAVNVGGKDASNYTPGKIDEVRCSNVLPGPFAAFTAPTAPFREIYPPGYTTSPDVEAA